MLCYPFPDLIEAVSKDPLRIARPLPRITAILGGAAAQMRPAHRRPS